METPLTLSVLLLTVSTLVTGARRVGRIDQNHGDTLAFGFIKEKGAQSSKTPPMEGTPLFLSVLASVSNSLEIFEYQHISRREGSQNSVCNHMVLSSLKPCPAF